MSPKRLATGRPSRGAGAAGDRLAAGGAQRQARQAAPAAQAPNAVGGLGAATESRAPAARALADNAPAPALAAAGPSLEPASRVAVPGRFIHVSLDTAVVRLQGNVRLIDGMRPTEVEVGPGRMVDGAARDLALVRVTYIDPRGRRLVLQQQRLTPGADVASGLGVSMLYGDTVVTTGGGASRVRWVDNRSFWLSLEGPLPADSLRVLVERVR